MDEKIKKWLFDIQNSISEIEHYFHSGEKSFYAFQSNTMLKRAIERDLEIIGEAINRILKENPSVEITSARKIVGLRNQIIHSYDTISDENIWGIIVNHLPKLKIEVDLLLNS